MSDKISVIVPVYNLEAYIERTVASIQAQTYQNLEIILVNDGSRDKSPELLRQLEKADSRIKVISQENAGVTRARLTGVKAAAGEWIGFVDGDDYIEPDMYERLLKNAIENKADIAHCGYRMVFPSRVDFYYNTGRLVKQDNLAGLNDLISGEYIEPGLWNKLYRRELFSRLLHDNIMDMSIKNCEDLLMNFYLFRDAHSSVFEDFCPYHYTIRKNSAATSGLNNHKLRDPLLVLNTIKQQVMDCPQLLHTVDKRILAALVHLATLYDNKQRNLITPHRRAAQKELQRMTVGVIQGLYPNKQKLQAAAAAACPWGYAAVHTLYALIRGTDKKYEIK